jgi:hypothetical protein
MNDQKSNANAAVLAVNGMRYSMPKPLSTTLIRTSKRQYSQRQEYEANDTIVFDLNISGQVDPELSYLTFKLAPLTSSCQLPSHGACSVIRDVRVQSKNGVELDRIQSYNAWSNVYVSNYIDVQEFATNSGILAGALQVVPTAGRQIVIPMSWISGLFRPHVKGQKIPSHLLSGARIELALESFTRALKKDGVNPDPTGYKIERPTIVFMEHTLNDNTLKVLTEESANNGLEYVYDRVFTSIETTNATVLHTQIKKAVSQACSIITSIHDPADQNDVTKDSFISITPAGKFNKFQYRLASNYFPFQPVDDLTEAFKISKGTFPKLVGGTAANSYGNYVIPQAGTSTFIVAVPLQTDHSISSSGLAVNNSATVALEYEGDNSNKIYYTFLVYTALARTFLNQVSVKI